MCRPPAARTIVSRRTTRRPTEEHEEAPPSGRVFVPIGEVSLRSALLAPTPGDEDTQAVADSLLEEMGDHRGDAFAVHGHAFRAGGLLQRLKQHGQ